ncbi:MAG: ArsR family transcriptional regulator [Proteobacteria bacterium]|nr:ArsR family transcriptional regulator [Pseudomonadota bacterium]
MAEIDKLIHERARLLILTFLTSNRHQEVSFNELQENLEFTSGNLSIQLKKLKEADYVQIDKTFKDNKPYTTVSISAPGAKALNRYVDEMEKIIKTLKK